MRSTILAALLLSACGATVAGGSPSPHSFVFPTPSGSAAAVSGPQPGSAVRITVNGAPYQQGVELPLTPTGGPVVVVMTFPFAVDRPSLERWLPMTTAAITWVDGRTVRVAYPETETNISFKAPETRAADGSAVVGQFSVRVAFPATRVIDLFTVAELRAIKTTGVRTAATGYRVNVAGGLTVSPDGRRAVAFDAVGVPSYPAAPSLIDLAARTTAQLAQPPAADGPFAFADWLPDGRLLIVGRSVWIGNGDGTGMRKLADAATALGGLPWSAVPSPSGERVALWAYNADGHVAIVDLRDGAVARVAGPFRRSAADAGVRLAWSRDGALLAGTDSDSEEGPAKARVRIADVAADRTARTIEGGVIGLSAFPTGELVVMRDSGERGAGQRLLGLVVGFDGLEHRRYLGCGWSMSGDARYLMESECGGAGYPGYTLIDLSTGASEGFGAATPFARWLADGRAAFY
ncbi:MAG: hypothetical protein QOH08_2292 [Chloroflexota bacterium]|nr:hypothetical protein [Chloroflexota bacterium]